MKTIITPTREIPQEMLAKIKAASPWHGLQSQLGTENSQDPWVNFARNQTSGYIEDNGSLVTYAAIGQDNLFNHNIAQHMGLREKNTALLMYLFTVPHYKQQGFAKELIDALGAHAKAELGVDSLIRTTGSDETKNIYLRYGATQHLPTGKNIFIEENEIENDHFLQYKL